MGNIRVSEKHGVNPSIEICFWCRKEIGVALLGRLPNDAAAPRHIVSSYEPCEECAKKFKLGILIFAAREPENDKERRSSLFSTIPLGPYAVMPREKFAEFFQGEAAERALEVGACAMELPVWNQVFGGGDEDA